MSYELNRRELLVLSGVAAMGACMGLCSTSAFADAAGTVDIGPAAGFASGVSDKFAKSNGFMVVSQDGKVFAVTSVCSHKKAQLKLVDGQFRCPAHGSRFGVDGKSTKGPATTPLCRYAISKNAAGNLVVDKSTSFDDQHWDDPASFVSIK